MDPYQPPDDRDFDNPYAPPQSAFVPEAAPELFGRHAIHRQRHVQLELVDFQGTDGDLLVDLLGRRRASTWAISVVLELSSRTASRPACEIRIRSQSLYILIACSRSIVIQIWLRHRHDPGHAQDRPRRAGRRLKTSSAAAAYLLTTILACDRSSGLDRRADRGRRRRSLSAACS